MYLLDADDEHVADLRATLAHARRQPRRGRRRRAVERPRARRRRRRRRRGRDHRRPPAPRSGSPTSPTRSPQARAATAARPATGRKVVAVAAGSGPGRAVRVGGRGRRDAAVRVSGPPPVSCSRRSPAAARPRSCVLPNDADTVRAAEIAARTAEAEHDVTVEVIPTQAQVQGLAAISVHEPGRAFDADVREMTATARHARHGAVTVAARQAITMAGPCEPGDALGVIAGDFAVVGSDLDEVAVDVLERLLGGGGELVTIVVRARTAWTSPAGVAGLRRGAPPRPSTSPSTTAASRATRCSSASSEAGRISHGRHHPGQPDRRGLRQPATRSASSPRRASDCTRSVTCCATSPAATSPPPSSPRSPRPSSASS